MKDIPNLFLVKRPKTVSIAYCCLSGWPLTGQGDRWWASGATRAGRLFVSMRRYHTPGMATHVTTSCICNSLKNWKGSFSVAPKFLLKFRKGFKNKFCLKVHKIENFFDSDFGICVISLLVMSKY